MTLSNLRFTIFIESQTKIENRKNVFLFCLAYDFKKMYRRPKFLETLLEIREEMSREANYSVELFAELIKTGSAVKTTDKYVEVEKNGKPLTKEQTKLLTELWK